jgi:ankyrin repeat protein
MVINLNYSLSIIQNGSTGLMHASWQGFTETVNVLLAAIADPNITDEVKLHYSHYLCNSNSMHYVTGW